MKSTSQLQIGCMIAILKNWERRKTMAKKFSDLRSKMSSAAKAESEREFHRLIQEMPLQKLRSARKLTQQNLAKVLDVNQSEISKIENRTDIYVSTLASYVEAMGGRLEIRAVFPEGEAVKINQFEEIATKSDG
jgi:DNA-binding XRE family transcriptional regulator